jgi:hypothetical protein
VEFAGKEANMKWVALLLLVLIPVSLVEAREVGKPVWGIKAGFTGANMYGDDTGIFKTRYGGLFGGSVEYPLTEMISLQGEVLYAMKGWKNDKFCGGLCELNQSISQIEIPMLIRLNSPASGPGPYLIMGPALYIGVSDELEVTVDGVDVPVDTEDYTAKGVEFGAVVGGGVTFPVENYMMSIEARGSIAGTPAYEDFDTSSGSKEWDAQNVTASLVVGVSF